MITSNHIRARKGIRRLMAWLLSARTPATAMLCVVIGLAAAVSACGGSSPKEPPANGSALAVKIDNIAAARPATGLGDADVIYVEPVEGGLTRLLAMFFDHRPDIVGPVRSARLTDLDVLGQYGRPAFAYSGSAPYLVAPLRTATVVNASPAEAPGAYFRSSRRAAPHNLYVRAGELPDGNGPDLRSVWHFGAAPAGGTPTTDHRVRYRAASFTFHWSPDTRRWQVGMDGTPFTSTETGQLTAADVIVQTVTTRPSGFPGDTSGVAAPAQTTGSGPVTVLRDGKAFSGRWSRPAAESPTRLTTDTGEPLPLADGPVWVLLTP